MANGCKQLEFPVFPDKNFSLTDVSERSKSDDDTDEEQLKRDKHKCKQDVA